MLGHRPEVLDERKVEPEALALSRERTVLLEGLLHERKVRSLKERRRRSDRVRRVGDDDVERVLDGREVLETVGDVDGDLRVREDIGHAGEVDLGHAGNGLQKPHAWWSVSQDASRALFSAYDSPRQCRQGRPTRRTRA